MAVGLMKMYLSVLAVPVFTLHDGGQYFGVDGER